MKIVFIGCVQSSYLFLKKLIENHIEIEGVITKQSSKFNSDFCDLGKVCEEYGIDYLYVNHVNDIESKLYIRNKQPDLILCLGWSQLLDREVLSIPSIGCIGFHPAALPFNRGRHPIIWALALGLKNTASSLFFMDEKADTGKVISQKEVYITYEDDAGSLYKKIMDIAVDQLIEVLDNIEHHRIPNDIISSQEGNVWRKRGKCDGEVDWRMSSENIYNLVRALTHPYVGAHFCFDGNEYKVWKVREIITDEYENIEPGKVLKILPQSFYVKAGKNVIEILECDSIDISVGLYL